jgi:exodeoxyribonuclease VII small subunit
MPDTATEQQQPEDITFEAGYDQLKGIVSRLKEEDVPVHEMFEKFRRGKGLEKSLRVYLEEREGELSEIEQGTNVPEFRVVAPSDNAEGDAAPPAPAGSSDDDIPF